MLLSGFHIVPNVPKQPRLCLSVTIENYHDMRFSLCSSDSATKNICFSTNFVESRGKYRTWRSGARYFFLAVSPPEEACCEQPSETRDGKKNANVRIDKHWIDTINMHQPTFFSPRQDCSIFVRWVTEYVLWDAPPASSAVSAPVAVHEGFLLD